MSVMKLLVKWLVHLGKLIFQEEAPQRGQCALSCPTRFSLPFPLYCECGLTDI